MMATKGMTGATAIAAMTTVPTTAAARTTKERKQQ